MMKMTIIFKIKMIIHTFGVDLWLHSAQWGGLNQKLRNGLTALSHFYQGRHDGDDDIGEDGVGDKTDGHQPDLLLVL